MRPYAFVHCLLVCTALQRSPCVLYITFVVYSVYWVLGTTVSSHQHVNKLGGDEELLFIILINMFLCLFSCRSFITLNCRLQIDFVVTRSSFICNFSSTYCWSWSSSHAQSRGASIKLKTTLSKDPLLYWTSMLLCIISHSEPHICRPWMRLSWTGRPLILALIKKHGYHSLDDGKHTDLDHEYLMK